MDPDLEVVQIGRGESFTAWEHGYPFRTVRWHFHPEYELHHVVATSGRYSVGDFIGTFAPGNLVLTGPNLPHNWVSDVAPQTCIPLRTRVVQFTEPFIADVRRVLPELRACAPVLEKSRGGVLFSEATASEVGPMLERLGEAVGSGYAFSAVGHWSIDRTPGFVLFLEEAEAYAFYMSIGSLR